VLIGEVPYVRFKNNGESFPCDLFYMDLDGTWTDTDGDGNFETHTGAKELEIWVSRLKVDNLTLLNPKDFVLNAYFDKNHRFRTGTMSSDQRAMAYVDGLFSTFDPVNTAPFAAISDADYGPGQSQTIQNLTAAQFKTDVASKNNEFVFTATWAPLHNQIALLKCQTSPLGCTAGVFTSLNLLQYDPHWFVYLVAAPQACDFSRNDSFCSTFALNPDDSGMLAIGNTRKKAGISGGEMNYFTGIDTSGPMGAVFVAAFNQMLSDPSWVYRNQINYYGMVLIGDASVRLGPKGAYALDTDKDGLNDVAEVESYGTDPNNPDTDADGLSDGMEVLTLKTDPLKSDSDGDGLTDGDEVKVYNTSPVKWDSEGDYLPDGYEVMNLSGHSAGENLDPLNPDDGGANFDTDPNPNNHEYWNRSNPWIDDPVPVNDPDRIGCYYWADADGDGYAAPGDVALMELAVAGYDISYSLDHILPHAYDPLDLDQDGYPGPGDIYLLQIMVALGDMSAGYASSPQELTVDATSGPTAVAVGSTTHVTLSVTSRGPGKVKHSSGFGVVFWVESGNAILLGGEGSADGHPPSNRYDISMEAWTGGLSNIVIKVTGQGPVIIKAKIPACGWPPFGRWAGEVKLDPPVVINGP